MMSSGLIAGQAGYSSRCARIARNYSGHQLSPAVTATVFD